MSLSDSLDLPKPFGPYTLLRRLAVGGMAEVYVAKTKGIGGFEKLVAIKVIHPRFSEDEHFVQMLVEEAKITVQLNHVNIAQTFDLGCIDDTYYIAMEFIEGADTYRVQKKLEEQKAKIPLDIAAYIAAEVCNGLAYAHRKRDAEGRSLGIVHRDISPQNVLVSFAGEVKIVDFGIAKAALRSGQTEVGVIKGKYYYMSPEQAWGDPVDARTDVFATGILLHEFLTGQMVYQEDNVPALLDKVRKAEIVSPRARRSDVPAALEAIVMQAVAREVSDRFQSAQAMCQELTRFLYSTNATFTAARGAQLMATLFPEESKRHSQIIKLQDGANDSEEKSLPRLSREELPPLAAESSVIMKLPKAEEPKPASARDRPTAQLHKPKPRQEEVTRTAPVPPPPESSDWDDSTLLKDGGWDESTVVDEGGDMMLQVHKLLGAKPRAADKAELPEDKTIAMTGAPLPPSRPPIKAAPLPRPLAAPVKVIGAPSAPPPRPMPLPMPLPMPAPSPSSIQSMELSSKELDLDEDVDELKAEKTIALVHGESLEAAAADAAKRRRPLTAPSQSGVRLGPEADRFFSQTTAPVVPPGPFDPIPTGPMPPAAAMTDPFAAMLTETSAPEDPFSYRPPANTTGPHEPLGKPQPVRWILPILVAGIGLAAVITIIIVIVSAGSDDPVLEIISVPDGAQVLLDDRQLAGATPLTINEGLEADSVHQLEVRKPGFEPYRWQGSVAEGTHRQIFVLNQIRATLHVESDPPNAQVWVDNAFRGTAPLDVIGLSAGQTIEVRAAAPGRQTVSRSLTIGAEERTARVDLQLPAL